PPDGVDGAMGVGHAHDARSHHPHHAGARAASPPTVAGCPHASRYGITSRRGGRYPGPSTPAFQLRAQPLLLLAQFGREHIAEVLRLEYRADLDDRLARHRVRAAPDPGDRLVQRSHLPQPET